MPAKTVLFDQRTRTLHDFGSSPHNFIAFNPQGRLIALAGFGNLAGKLDVFDRRSLTKVTTIDAPNTSHCEWSPDGRFILTATLSPRLRVDNGIKVWHCSGPLMHYQAIEELYQASWRPTPIDAVPQFGQTIPAAPEPSDSVKDLAIAKAAPTKPAGAYRPPGARGSSTPSIFKREDEGGAARMPTNGTATPPRGPYSRSPGPGNNGYGHGHGVQNGGGRRHVPGAAPQHAGSPAPDDNREKKNKKKKEKKKDGAKERDQVAVTNGATPVPVVAPAPKPAAIEINIDPSEALGALEGGGSVPPTPGDLSLDPLSKKIRNLNKKVMNPRISTRTKSYPHETAQGHRRA